MKWKRFTKIKRRWTRLVRNSAERGWRKKMSLWAFRCQLWAEAARRESITRTLGMSSYLNQYYTEIQKKCTEIQKKYTEVPEFIGGRVSVWCFIHCSDCAEHTRQCLHSPGWIWNCACGVIFPHLNFPFSPFFFCICHVCDWTLRDWSLKCYADAGPPAYFNSFSF